MFHWLSLSSTSFSVVFQYVYLYQSCLLHLPPSSHPAPPFSDLDHLNCSDLSHYFICPSLIRCHSFISHVFIKNLLWRSGKESSGQCRRHGFYPWVGKIPWRRKWQPTIVFLPGKSHGQRSLAGYSPWGHKRVEHDLAAK